LKYSVYEPFQTENLLLKNRIVKSATAESMATEGGFVTQKLIEFYRKLAEGGIGTIITGFMFISEEGRVMKNMTGISSDEHIEGLRKLVKEVKKADRETPKVNFVAQLVHAGRQSPFNPVAPSAVMEATTKITPRELSREEIYRIIDDFAKAAIRAEKAGFDAVQLHAAHGYLLSQFISPYTNRRKDEFGQERAKILLDIIEKIREKSKIPVMIKMNAADFIPGGLEVEEAARIAKLLENAGYEAIEVSAGMWESKLYTKFTVFCQNVEKSGEAYFKDFARKIKEKVEIPIILVGGIRSIEVAEKLIGNCCDLISMARPLIRDPYLPRKWKESPSDCKSCNKCLKNVVRVPLACFQR
jgi:2,4-dienoyl-CoA reductase-like NADH-dependent reductase (Old Yellow Enzyme family)